MMTWRRMICILSLFWAASGVSIAWSQVMTDARAYQGRVLHRIEIVGNDITDPDIILREMKLKPGMGLDPAQLEADYLRILGLDIFHRVELWLSEEDGGVLLRIEVTEQWYIFPIPFFDLSSEDPSEYTYGFRYMQRNFRGRDETLRAYLWGGVDRGFRFTHINPWVRGTPSFTRAIDLYQVTHTSKRLALEGLEQEIRQTVFQLYFGKRWTLELSSQVGTRFRLVQADTTFLTVSKSKYDRIQELLAWATWDGRDLRQFPRGGTYSDVWFSQGWVQSSGDRFQRLLIDLRKYIDFGLFSLCSRSLWTPSWGDLPPYDWVIVQQTTPIRSSNLKDEGPSFWMAAVEARFDILPVRYYTWHQAPYFKKHFRNLKYGLAGEIFTDFGDAYTRSDEFGIRSLLWGYGAGLLLQLPYVDIVRLEISWNPDDSFSNPRLAWKIGVSF